MIKEKRIGEILGRVALYVLALIIVAANVGLMFDHVVWGDEAFSINTAKNTFAGILEILYYCDNHPPLHYFWLKIFGDVFGHNFYVYHLASVVPFVISIIFVVTLIRKHIGNIPSAFLVVILGLGYFCLEYNLEIRMYSLAFLGVFMSFYCAFRVITENRKRAYVGMVLWALLAAYSHYYALVTVGILMFMTTVCVWVKNKGKSWIRGALSMLAFLAGYGPWFYFLYTAIKTISGTWWMTDIVSFRKVISMILGGHGLNWWILALLAGFSVVLFVWDRKNRSIKTYVVAVGFATILATVAFAYGLCFFFKPMLAQRYMYPLSAVTFFTLAVAMSRVLEILKEKYSESRGKVVSLTKAVLVAVLFTFIGIGMGNFRVYKEVVTDQENKTKATLNLIGEPSEDTMFVTNGVKHLGWTIFPCYFPETEFISANCYGATKDKFWYFNPVPISEEELAGLAMAGYDVISYGQMQISQYIFSLYYMER